MTNKPHIVLGLYEGHMASAVLMIDGSIVAGSHEERFSKLKMDVGLPVEAARFCLAHAGILPAQVDEVALVGLALDPRDHLTKRYATFSVDDYIYENVNYWYPRLVEGKRDVDYFDVMGHERIRNDHYWDLARLDLKDDPERLRDVFNDIRLAAIEKHLEIPRGKVRFMPHYLCHHYHAYYSGTVRGDDVVVVHNEAIGDGYNAVVSVPSADQGLKVLCGNAETDLGRLYKWITLLLGMKPHQHEFKVMGLAPYANNYERAKAAKVFDPLFRVDPDAMLIEYAERPQDLFFHFREALAACRFDGIAAALQDMVERRLTEWFSAIVRGTGRRRVCYAGGVAMNVKANMMLAASDDIDQLFVPLSPADETTPMGAAYWVTADHMRANGRDPDREIPPLENVYLGRPLDQSSLGSRLGELRSQHGFSVEQDPAVERVAELIADGVVVARARERSEYGQRSLGNRSILANPAADGVVEKINSQIKYRDFWMPFCPSMLDTEADAILVNDKDTAARFMTVSFPVREEKQKAIAGAMHAGDKTARPQVLERRLNPEYYDLIAAVGKRTGTGCILNTSLNLHGDPMADEAEDALKTFLNSDLDALWVGDYLLRR